MADFTPHEAPAREAQALPLMLPGKPVGRDEQLKTVYAHLKANKAVLICGPAGIGKTALAATLANAYTQQPGGVLWFTIADNTRLEDLLVRVGRAYKVSQITNSETPAGMIGAVATTLTQNKPLVVLDGKLNPQVAAQFASKCLSGLPAIITAEESAPGPWESVELGKLEPEAAAALFKQQSNITASTSDIDIYGIVKALGHTPFAVVIAARAMLATKQTPETYLPMVQQVATAAGGNGQLAALTASYRGLVVALQGLVLMMGATFGGQASSELLSMISDAPQEKVQQAMTMLAQLQLVERFQRYSAPYYRLHSITYLFAQSGLKGSNRLEGLQTKVRDSVLAYAKKYSAADPQSHDKLAAEMDNFLAVARWAADQGDRDVANQLLLALTQAGDFVNARGYVHELLTLRGLGTGYRTAFPAYAPEMPIKSPEALLTEDDEEDLDDGFDDDELTADEADFTEDEEDEEDYEDDEDILRPEDDDLPLLDDITSLRTALVHARRTNDAERQIEILQAIGKAQIGKDMETEAIATYTEALACYEDMKDMTGQLDMLDMLSALMVKTENAQAAILHATRGIKLADEIDDSETKMHLLITLGDARQQSGESAESVRAYQQALEQARTDEDQQNEAIILFKLGYAQLDEGEPKTAIDTWEQAREMFKTQEKRDYEGRVLGGMGTAYGELGQWAEAINLHTSALHIAREVKDKDEEALQLGYMAYAAVQANRLKDALLPYRQALHLHYESDNRENIVSTIVDIVRLLLKSRRYISVAELLIDDALRLEPHDKDVNQLKEQVTADKAQALADGVQLVDIAGTAQDYAENAYRLLED